MKKLAKKRAGGVIRVGLHMPKAFWEREAGTLASLMTNGNKSKMVRELIELELKRRICAAEKRQKPPGYSGLFLRD